MSKFISALALGAFALSLSAAPARADEKAVLTETVGAVTAGYLYSTNQLIGMLSDAKAKGLYDQKVAMEELGKIHGLLGAIEAQFEKAGKALGKEEKEFADTVLEINGLLKKQVLALKELWGGDKAKADDFVKARAAAGKKINAFLGIKE